MARAEAEQPELADEEAAAPLVASGAGARRAGASATRDVHLLSAAFLFVFLACHAAQNLQSTVNTVDNRDSSVPKVTPAEAAKMCHRNFGIGADGVIFVMPRTDLRYQHRQGGIAYDRQHPVDNELAHIPVPEIGSKAGQECL